MATGFHGFHVLIGTIFLIVCLVRAYAGHFTPKQHLGFEFAAWYWHFVDVVWLFLFAGHLCLGLRRPRRRERGRRRASEQLSAHCFGKRGRAALFICEAARNTSGNMPSIREDFSFRASGRACWSRLSATRVRSRS